MSEGDGERRPVGLAMRVLASLAERLCASPVTVLVVCLVLTAAAGTRALRLQVSTSRTNLGHASTAAEEAFGEFLLEFGTPNDVIGVIDAPAGGFGEEALRAVADELAAALEGDGAHVRSTFHKVDLDFFLRHLLLFIPLEDSSARSRRRGSARAGVPLDDTRGEAS
jgi:hypothetical protein